MMNAFSARLGVKKSLLITLFARSRHKKIIGDLPFLDGGGGGMDGYEADGGWEEKREGNFSGHIK